MPSEADTRANFIDPALAEAGWSAETIVREHYFTDGRKLSGGQRGSRCFVDYLLHADNRYLAIIEAKARDAHPTKGLQQALDYAEKLCVRFVYASNGEKIYEFDRQTGGGLYVDAYPSPSELAARYAPETTDLARSFREIPFHIEGNFTPRYYQELAVHAVTDALGADKSRILLTLATGTGKTFIAFQIVHKLFQSRWSRDGIGQRRPRILFLADRNVLADQAINTFNPYERDLIKIDGDEVRRRHGIVPTNANIFFAIYQALTDREREAENIGGYYREYPRDFFDLVIIDECHRGAANEYGSWRAVLEHFESAIHLGMTATPRRTDNIDTYSYFGDPVYQYSLKEGINDGFLTPYRVKRIRTNLDELVLNDEDEILKGVAEKPVYETSDYDRNIVVDERTELVAKSILEQIDPMDKTIIFCTDQNHALTMRDMINKHKTVRDPNYCVRITSDEGKPGRQLLEKFQDNDKDIPTILTSSQMLTTGVDARNVRNIVLDRTIRSMVEFKQIIGRGTRVFEGKDHFTIIDLRGATNLFYDAEWDGEPLAENTPPETAEPQVGPHSISPEPAEPQLGPKKEKLTVRLGPSRISKVIDVEIRYIDETGRPLTAQQFIDRILGKLPELFASEEELRRIWSDPDTRETFYRRLADAGFDARQLSTLRHMFNADACDLFDLLNYLLFERPMATRHDRATATRSNAQIFQTYDQPQARKFLMFVLDRYEQTGEAELARDRMPGLIQLSGLGTTRDVANAFGGNATNVLTAFRELQHELYHCA